ncbi:MAG: insulinase family protein [bacterium]|nr:insulinase family protein [Candidatus Kapabacteria bacterium]
MHIYVVNRPELPKVSVSLRVRAGTMADPRGKEGLATLTTELLDDGTSTRKALDISDQLGDLGVYFGLYSNREYATATFEALERNVDNALAIVSDAVRNPSFATTEFEREKNRLLDVLAQQETDPGTVTWRVARMMLFGKDHPYGRPSEGLPSTVQKLTAADVAEFHRTWWKPDGSALVFVGAVTLDEATAMARKHFSSWKGSAPALTIPPTTPAPPGRIYLIDRQDAAQTTIAQVLPGAARNSNDYYAIKLADGVWGGGGFANRLNLNLREDKGYSYGIYSFPQFHERAGWWSAGGSVQTDKTKESIAEMIGELRSIGVTKPITADELERSRDLRLRGFAQDFETLGQVGGNVLEAWSYGLPMSDIGREPGELKKIDLAQVNDVVRRYLSTDKSFFVLVGDRSKVEPKLRELAAGEIVIVDAEGNIVNDARADEPRPVPGKP